MAAIAGYRESGLTQVAYAESVGIKVGNLRRWITRGTPATAEKTGLATVQLIPGAPSRLAKPATANATTLTIQWPSGVQAEVRFGSDTFEAVRWLKELVS